MKKIVSLMATVVLTAGILVGCGGSGKYADGTYTGEGQGTSGVIKVEVSVAKGKISDVKILEHNETKTLIDGVKDNMVPAIVEKQGTEGVDTVAGATNSSKGVLEAVNKALEGAAK
ncbi:MAG: FMN-binding protein [Clostridium sp.]